MLEPNFSESQLQTAANLAFANEIRRRVGGFPFPFVPSLPAEFLLGWDTAFDLEWVRRRLSGPFANRHKGCNFFLQYKLSGVMEHARNSKEWSAWQAPYFRFRIPHRKKVRDRVVDDFHQWERLKEIAAAGVPTCYATNTMLEESELRQLFETRTLLDRVVLLDVAPIKRKHIHASFADPFTKFMLHSVPEESELITLTGLINKLSNATYKSYEEGIVELTSIAVGLSKGDRSATDAPTVEQELASFQQFFITYTGPRVSGLPQLKRAILEAFYIRRFGLRPHWYPAH